MRAAPCRTPKNFLSVKAIGATGDSHGHERREGADARPGG